MQAPLRFPKIPFSSMDFLQPAPASKKLKRARARTARKQRHSKRHRRGKLVSEGRTLSTLVVNYS